MAVRAPAAYRSGVAAPVWGAARALPAPVRRDVVDHALARRAVLAALTGAPGGGRVPRVRTAASPLDEVCDAAPELLRAAVESGRPSPQACPVCSRPAMREVAWVFGDALGCLSGTPRTPVQLAALALRRPEFTVYEVEVCTACRWNVLLRSWRTGTACRPGSGPAPGPPLGPPSGRAPGPPSGPASGRATRRPAGDRRSDHSCDQQ